jgi:hypothetical protein
LQSREHQLQLKQFSSQGSNKLIDQRGRVGQSQQIQGLTSSTNQKNPTMVGQSLDHSLQVHLHKRKASNDEGRIKNQSRLSQQVNMMQPFLDQSIDFTNGGPSKLLKEKTNTMTSMQQSAPA